jgi:hypothetical protein
MKVALAIASGGGLAARVPNPVQVALTGEAKPSRNGCFGDRGLSIRSPAESQKAS